MLNYYNCGWNNDFLRLNLNLVSDIKLENKTIFVIHNYSDLIRIKDVEDRIEIDIKSTFLVKPHNTEDNSNIFID